MGQPPKAGRTTRLSATQTEERARWVIERKTQRPDIRPQRLEQEIRERFQCGKTAAEQAVKRYHEILRDEWNDPKREQELRSTIERRYEEIAETATRRGELRAARAALDSLVRLRGLAAPEKIEHSGSIALPQKLGNMPDAQLAELLKSMGISLDETPDDKSVETPSDEAVASSTSDA